MKMGVLMIVIILTITGLHYTHAVMNNSPISIHPSTRFNVNEGQNLEVNCSVNNQILHPHVLYWKVRGAPRQKIHQEWPNNHTATLVIKNITRADAGMYQCYFNSSKEEKHKGLFIQVNSKLSTGPMCSSKEFLCETSKKCIYLSYRCNRKADCDDGSDEMNCQYADCEGMHICQNGKCINKTLVCDENHDNHCGDWSDEYCLMDNFGASGTNIINATVVETTGDDTHMSWLKTTVYAVIGCTVGTVLFISIIVIAVFRFRMKSSFRSTERALRRYHIASSRNHDRNSGVHEMDPFLSASSNYGNIIVNVNNGVQYIPRNEYTSLMGVPPSYSDVEREMNNGRGSPPPVYSTIDRNPRREVINFNNYIIQDSYISSACAPCLPSLSRDSSTLSDSEYCGQVRPNTNNVSVQTASASVPFENCGDNILSVQTGSLSDHSVQSPASEMCANSSEYREIHDTHNSQNLTVQQGQIILQESSETSEPVSNMPTSNPPNMSLCQQNPPIMSQCQQNGVLNVRDGHIILSNQTSHAQTRQCNSSCQNFDQIQLDRSDLESCASTYNTDRSEYITSQLQVENGKIVFTENSPCVSHATNNSLDIESTMTTPRLEIEAGRVVLH